MKKNTLKMTRIALLTCIVFVCAQITIPLGGVPMTLQTFAIALCGNLLGVRQGLLTIAVYLTLGAIGIPVFAGFGGSIGFFGGPTGGFLLGFLPFVAFCGVKTSSKRKYLYDFFGLLCCHIMGILWFAYVSRISLMSAFLWISLPYLIKDILSVIFARFLTLKMHQRCPRLFLF